MQRNKKTGKTGGCLKAAHTQASCPFLKQSDGSGIEVLDKSQIGLTGFD